MNDVDPKEHWNCYKPFGQCMLMPLLPNIVCSVTYLTLHLL